jgi:tetratricopeptide (TPR) repeat protein
VIFIPLLVLGGWFAHYSTFTQAKVYQMGLGIQESRYPVKAVDFLREEGFKGNLFNSWKLGGYIQWHLPEVRTLIDGRVFNKQIELFEALAAMNNPTLQNFVNEHDVEAAIITKTDRRYLNFFEISPHFDLVFSDDQAVVYLRKDSTFDNRPARKNNVFRYIRPDSTNFSYLIPLAKSPQASEVEAELRRAIELAPGSFIAHLTLGIFLEELDRVEALDHYFDAANINPGLGFIHFGLCERAARFAIKHKQWARAQEILQHGKQFKTNSAELDFLLATTLYMSGDLDKAEDVFRNLLTTNPNQINLLINLGFLYIDSARYSDAIPLFKQAWEHAPNLESALYGLALALQESGNESAAEYWRKFLIKFPESRWASKARAYLVQ